MPCASPRAMIAAMPGPGGRDGERVHRAEGEQDRRSSWCHLGGRDSSQAEDAASSGAHNPCAPPGRSVDVRHVHAAACCLDVRCLHAARATARAGAEAGWALAIHGGAGVIERGDLANDKEIAYRAGAARRARRRLEGAPPRAGPAWMRSKPRSACSKTTRCSTRGAARCSPPTAATSSTPRSWTAPHARRAPWPA